MGTLTKMGDISLYNVPAGDPAIYSNPDVFQPPTKPGALDTPMFKDKRGVIQRLNKNNLDWLDEYQVKAEFPNTLYTKAGFMRSGDLHKNSQLDYIIEGELELWTLEQGKTVKQVLGPNTFIVLGAHTPHLFRFTKDTVMQEWWSGKFEAWYYKPYRDIIDKDTKERLAAK